MDQKVILIIITLKQSINMKAVRIIAFSTGLLTLVWQIMQIANGKGQNIFLIADIILAIVLMATALLKPEGKNVTWLIAALGFACGVFSTATFGGLTMDTYNFGAFTTTVGLLLCLACIIWFQYKKKE
jgi:peptidoglycan/LPS O-acetylase OafA/YrhL